MRSFQLYHQRMSSSYPTQPTLFALLLLIFKVSYCIQNDTVLCPEIEKQSLISFKQSMKDQDNLLLSSWNVSVNCCKWKGVICNNSTGHVEELHLERMLNDKVNPSLLGLRHLRFLDLSENMFSGDSIEWLLGLPKLEHLSMDGANLSRALNWAQVITSLPSLVEVYCDRCSLDFMAPLNDVNISDTSIKYLGLSYNKKSYASSVVVPTWIFRLRSLVSLDLKDNGFMGQIPSVSNATKLQYINLFGNAFSSNIPDWLYLVKDLKYVDLSSNLLNGTISSVVENLTSLNTFRVSDNQLSGKIPKEITNLCALQRLELSDNDFEGLISDSFGNMSECFLGSLRYLRLRKNRLSGHMTDQFGEFKNLSYLNLGWNTLSGRIPASIGKLSSLQALWLQENKFTGTLPQTLGRLFNLETLYIRNNKLEGVVMESHFANLTRLNEFYASGNRLTLKVSRDWNPPFQVGYLHLASWDLGVGSGIPSWLETQKNLEDLDLSDTGISGSIPSWLWNISILTLSRNRLRGQLPDVLGTKADQNIYLGSNQLSGALPRIADTLTNLDLSNNSFSGGMSHFLCDTAYETYGLTVLHLGGNQLSGPVPDCWIKWKSLKYLNLGDNNLSGSIPGSLGFLANLESLNLYANSFAGKIPFPLHNCTNLMKMDLAENDLDGDVPTWVGTSLVKLTFLILRSNKLTGKISSQICLLNSLQILDLSDNMISGVIPRCIHNFTAMATKRSLVNYAYDYYWWTVLESAAVVTKGSELQYVTILSLVNVIDLSKNNLSGDIPKELARLAELRSLNFSRNRLTGPIPDNIGDMKQLESLDVSINSLSGRLPNSFTLLSSLNYLNVSYNNLTGEIPKSTQIRSLAASGFVGNNLCGPPLTNKCIDGGDEEVHEHKEEEGDESKVEWLYVFISLGYAVGISIVCTTLVLNKSWRKAYFGLIECAWDKLYVYVSIRCNKLSKKGF